MTRERYVQHSISEADKERWHKVTVVAASRTPDGKEITDVLRLQSAQEGSPSFLAVPMNDAAKGLEKVLQRIDAFGALTSLWDSHSAKPISASACRAARGFIVLAANHLSALHMRLTQPFATPLPNGNVQLEWESGDTCLELEFAGPGAIHYLRMHGNDAAEDGADQEHALELVVWFHRTMVS